MKVCLSKYGIILLPVTLYVFLLVSLRTVSSQSTPNATESPTPEASITEPASAATILETTTSIVAATTENVESTTSTSLPPSPTVPEGFYDSPCNTTLDCQPNRSLHCLTGVCICPEPEVFDIREQRCIIPLGKQCLDSVLEDDDSNCPEFAECFMDRCVCKTGYSMHTMTRCKSDYLDGAEETAETKTKAQLWPKQALTQELNDKAGCTPATCDESKGLQCQAGGACKCKDSKELYIDEFGRCLSSNMQQSVKDALSLVTSSEDDIKSFVKLLEKFEDGDHEASGSENYERPIHHILELLGDHSKSEDDDKHSQVAPSRSYYDHMTAAQEPAESTRANDAGGNSDHDGHSRSGPPRQDPIPTEQEMGQPLPYGQDSQETTREPYHTQNHHYLPLDTYQSQGQEPQIVQRQAPAYEDNNHRHGEGIPLHGYGVIPESTNHFPLHGHGHGHGHGGYGHGGYGGGYHHPGHHGLAHHGLHHGPHGGFGGPGHHHHHHPPPAKPKPKPTILFEMAELLGRSFKLVDRFLPLIHVINDALKKESILHKIKDIKDKDDGHSRGHRDVSKEDKKSEVLTEGAMLAGFAKFMGLLLRLKKRLEVLGGADALKKILT